MFNQPSGSGFLNPKERLGHLVLFTNVYSSEQRPDNLRQGQLQTVYTVDYVDLDEPGAPLHERALVGSVGITNKLTTGATNVLGRITQMDTGQPQPASVLIGYGKRQTAALGKDLVDDAALEAQDVGRATQWVTAYTSGQIATASAQAQQQAPAPQVPQQAYPAQAAPVVPQPGYGQQVAPQGYPVPGQVPQGQPVYPQQAPAPQVPQTVQAAGPDFAAVQALLAQQGIGTQPVAGQGQPGY